MVKLGKEQPFERGESGNRSYLDHEAPTSISGGSSPKEQVKQICKLIGLIGFQNKKGEIYAVYTRRDED